jgi:hypothetical protein
MRRLMFLIALVLATAVPAVPAAYADSPHFIGTPECSKSSSGVLTCSGRAAGLGNGPVAAFLTADSVVATYECVNHGGNVAPGQTASPNNVTGPTQNITPRNGQIRFSPSLSPPPTPSAKDAGCPGANWTVNRTSLTYFNVVLHLQQPPGTDVLTFNFGDIDP